MTTTSDARGLRPPAGPDSAAKADESEREVRVPSSKSEALRAIVLAARADWIDGAVSIGPLPADECGGDVAAALRLAEGLGASVARDGERVLVSPRPRDHLPAGRVELDVGESGTLARFATAIAALDPHCTLTRISGSGTLARRRSEPLFTALEAAGASFEFEGARFGWPVVVRRRAPGDMAKPLTLRDACSSQEVSALMLAGGGPDAHHPGVLVHGVVPSLPYVDLTRTVMRCFGLRAVVGPEGGAHRIAVLVGSYADLGTVELEADASLAGVALAAACLAAGCVRAVRVPNILPRSPQGDAKVVQYLCAFGCDARRDAGGLVAKGSPTRGASLDLFGEPDLAPVLAAVAASAALRVGARSRLAGLETLVGKESDRLAGIAEALTAVGLAVDVEGREALVIGPGAPKADGAETAERPLVLDARGDHRMAFLHALLGLVVPGVVTRDGRCVDKTWPRFWDEMEALGLEVVRGA